METNIPDNNDDYPSVPLQPTQSGPLNQDIFMKYASSIIQVVTEEVSPRARENVETGRQPVGGQAGQQCILREGEGEARRVARLPELRVVTEFQLGHCTNQVQPFRKKREAQVFCYSLTNCNTLTRTLSILRAKLLRAAFESVKGRQYLKDQCSYGETRIHQKQRSSVNSGSTNYTSLDELRTRRQHLQLESQRQINLQQQLREAANSVVGWIQFKLLMLQSQAMKQLREQTSLAHRDQTYPSRAQISVIGNKRDLHFSQKFYLTEYLSENSVSMGPHCHQLEESLVYTNDHHFQHSKDHTITTPEKLSREQEDSLREQRDSQRKEKEKERQGLLALAESRESIVVASVLPLTESHESIVSPYKAFQRTSKVTRNSHLIEQKSHLIEQKSRVIEQSLSQKCEPIELRWQSRRYLTVRTNLFELPLLSDNDLIKKETLPSNDLPLKPDQFIGNQPELICQHTQTILRDFQGSLESISKIGSLEGKATSAISVSKGISGSEQSDSNSYFNKVREKQMKQMEQIRQENHQTHGRVTAEYEQVTQSKTRAINQLAAIGEHDLAPSQLATQHRRAPQQIEHYYFPAKELRRVGKQAVEPDKSRLDEVKQVDSILSSEKKETIKQGEILQGSMGSMGSMGSKQGSMGSKQGRQGLKQVTIDQSIVGTFTIPEEPKANPLRKTNFPSKTMDQQDRTGQVRQAKGQQSGLAKGGVSPKGSGEPRHFNEPNRYRANINMGANPHPQHALPLSPSHALPLSPSHALPLSPSHALPLSPSHALPLSPSQIPPHSPHYYNPQSIRMSPSPAHNSNFTTPAKKDETVQGIPQSGPSRNSPYSQSPYQMKQQQPSSVRRMEPVIRSGSREQHLQRVSFNQNNVYQINQGQHHLKQQGQQHLRQQGQQHLKQQGHQKHPIHVPTQNQSKILRPPARVMSPQASILRPTSRDPSDTISRDPLRPGSKDPSLRKQTYFSPQSSRDQYGLQQQKQRMTSRVKQPLQQYCITEQPQVRPSKAINFNNRYYCTGSTQRQPPLMTGGQAPLMTGGQPPLMTGGQTPLMTGGQAHQSPHVIPPLQHQASPLLPQMPAPPRPHSSSRQSLEQLNIFSSLSESESSVCSGQMRSGGSWKELRPRSMNSKLSVTMRR